MFTVHEVSEKTGVSIRALHHYDAIGLLKPAKTTEAGYRLYDESSLARLQSILLFRELDFPLADVKRILDCPEFDEKEALRQQIELLTLKRERIERLIALAEERLKKGGIIMNFDAFDDKKAKEYAEEAKRRWGHTEAWREAEASAARGGDPAEASEGLMELFAGFSKLKTLPADAPEAAEAVKGLQSYITAHFYNCTDEILAGLGEMYSADGRFKENIDRAGGEGAAEFVTRAIRAYIKRGR